MRGVSKGDKGVRGSGRGRRPQVQRDSVRDARGGPYSLGCSLSGNCAPWRRFFIFYLLEEGEQGAVKSKAGRRFGAKDRPRCVHHGLQ
jgi:hypothetical protein